MFYSELLLVAGYAFGYVAQSGETGEHPSSYFCIFEFRFSVTDDATGFFGSTLFSVDDSRSNSDGAVKGGGVIKMNFQIESARPH